MIRKPALMTASLFVALLGTSACNQSGFHITSVTDEVSTSGGADSFQSLSYAAYIAGGNDDQTLAVSLDKTNAALILNLPLELNVYVTGIQGTIPQIPGASFSSSVNTQGRSVFTLNIPLRYVLKGVPGLTLNPLPNGDPLPDVIGGQLPSIAVPIPGKSNVQMQVYIGNNEVALFVASPFNPFVSVQFPLQAKFEDVGFFISVPAKGSYQGGFLLDTTLPPDVASTIDEYFHFR